MRASEFITERKKRKGKKPKYAAYGPGPYGWYGYNAGYSGDGGSGGDGGAGSESIQHEAAYEGNIGIMEVNKFFQIATPEQKKLFKQLLAADRTKDAWRLVQDVTNVKLKGKEFAEGWDDEDEIDKITLIKSLQWPELVNKVSSAMKAMGWKGQRKDDGSFMFSTRGQLDDEWYIVIIDNRGNNMFTYALGTVEEGDPHIGEQESLPMTEASVSELMNAIREGFGLNEQGLAENFADGRNPQDKGDAKRHGVPTKASVSTLRKVAKQGGRKGQLAHWMANMKAGKDKK